MPDACMKSSVGSCNLHWLYATWLLALREKGSMFLYSSLFCCRLNADEQIQMVTALALQLIQCVVKLPAVLSDSSQDDDGISKKKCSDSVCSHAVIHVIAS